MWNLVDLNFWTKNIELRNKNFQFFLCNLPQRTERPFPTNLWPLETVQWRQSWVISTWKLVLSSIYVETTNQDTYFICVMIISVNQPKYHPTHKKPHPILCSAARFSSCSGNVMFSRVRLLNGTHFTRN